MKKLLILLGSLLALLVVAWFVVTSSGFLKSVVLPRVGDALNARVEAESIALSPFSSVEIRRLTVTPNGAERLAAIEVARVRYNLMAILGGRLEIQEIQVGTPVVSLVRKPDGSSNLDPILRKFSSAPATPASPQPPASGKPVQLDLQSLRIENASVSYRATAADGTQTSGDVTGLGLAVTGLKNGGKAKVEVTSGLRFEQRTTGGVATNNQLQGALKGAFDLELAADLSPGAAAGRLDASLAEATGLYADLRGLGSVLAIELVPGELKRLGLDFTRQGAALGSLSVRGPLDLAKKEARLSVELSAIDRNILNLVGAGFGLDFATTRFDSVNQVELTAGGQRVSLTGKLTGSRVSVRQGELVLPSLDLQEAHDLSIDLSGQTATIKAFSLSGNQGGREVVRGTLAQPLQVGWAANAPALPDATLQFLLSDLRLADWSALAGTPLQGTAQARAELGVRGGGKDLGFEAAASLTGFSGRFGSNEVRNLGFSATAKGTVAAFAEAARRRLTMTSEVTNLTGTAAVVVFDQYAVSAQADLGLPEGEVVLNDIQVRLRQGTRDGGNLGVKGRWNTVRGAGAITVTAREVNENALRPFLRAALGEKQLRSVQLVADLSAQVDPAAATAIQASADLKNLVVKDPSGTVPESPLAAGVSVDFTGSAQQLSVKKGEVRLTPTARARNVASLTGDLDLSRTNALKGAFKLAAESIDVTPFFDLFAGGASSPAPGTTPPPAQPKPASGPGQEPAAITLPVELLTFNATVGKFYLREVAAENVAVGVKIAGSRIEVQPLQVDLNGAPIRGGATFNLGVPGYEYDLKLSADHIPVKPLANSFAPSLKDRIEGSMVAGLQVKGAGITGVNLQKHLVGGMNMAVTNANLKLTSDLQKGGLLSLLTQLLATALNIRELKDQPIMDVLVLAKMGEGKIELTDATARSASLEVGSTGIIPIAADLMASPLNFPVKVSLSRELAQRAMLVPANTPTNQAYVAIPDIASLKGTLGAPAPDVDKVKAGLLAARGLAGLLGGRAGDTVGGVADLVGGVAKGGTNAVGNLIQGIGGLFGGKTKAEPAQPAAAPSPAASTNPPAVAGASSSTNAPAPSNAPPANPLGGLIKGLLDRGQKK